VKKLYDRYPMLVGIAILSVYILLDVVDARIFIPRVHAACEGAMTEHQTDICYHWIIVRKKPDIK
jgi:hypothetical protein